MNLVNNALLRKIQLNDEQMCVFNALENTSNNYFVTGKAGTGKSTVLSYFRKHTHKENVVVVAYTGAAAINVEGQTIHSLFKMDFAPQDTFSKAKIENSSVKQVLESINVLIIDEISMVRADILDMIDHKMQYAKENNLPFGGCQVVAFGDLFQLAPIASTNEEKEFIYSRYGTLYFFGAPAAKQFKRLELSTVVRQNDVKFINMLNCIREGVVSENMLNEINNTCYLPAPDSWLRLTLKRNIAHEINIKHLSMLNGKEYVFNTELGGAEPPSKEDVPFDFILRIKIGAKVLMTCNHPEYKYYNGSTGFVKSISDNHIEVLINNKSYKVEQTVWEKKKYILNKDQLDCVVVGWAKQYPIRLAYAITVHKAQGQTYDNVVLDYSNGTVFTHGQTYVALSRCRTLEGIRLTRPLMLKDIYINKEVKAYTQTDNSDDIPLIENKKEDNSWKEIKWPCGFTELKDE